MGSRVFHLRRCEILMNFSVVYHEYYLKIYFYSYCKFDRNNVIYYSSFYHTNVIVKATLCVFDSQTLSGNTETLN